MALPAFARVEDLAARRPSGVANGEITRAQAALDDASSLMRTEVGKDWVDEDDPAKLAADVPAVFLTVACAAARRAFDNPDGVQAESLGSHSVTYAYTAIEVFLTKAEKRLVRRAAGLSNVWTQATTRDPDNVGVETESIACAAAGGEFLETDGDGGGEPILWGGQI